MPTKQSILHQLEHVKLVLGNGFDLICGLETRYSDFFNHFRQSNQFINDWLTSFGPAADGFLRHFAEKDNPDHFFQGVQGVNIWYLYFYLSSSDSLATKTIFWCDVEKAMLLSFQSENEIEGTTSKFRIISWSDVFHKLRTQQQNADGYLSKEKNPVKLQSINVDVLAAYALFVHGYKPFYTLQSFYQFLLNELMGFEKLFGKYIHKQRYDETNKDFGVVRYFAYSDKLGETIIQNIVNLNNVVIVDTFNYDLPKFLEEKVSCQHVNGSYLSPIFGVDSSEFDPSDDAYIFTKACRRIEADTTNESAYKQSNFENVIIYGHSLDKADESYFFSLFDQIGLNDRKKKSRVVFAYSIYDENQERFIRNDLRNKIFRLINAYSIYLGNTDKNSGRLLDFLTTEGRILTYQVPDPTLSLSNAYIWNKNM